MLSMRSALSGSSSSRKALTMPQAWMICLARVKASVVGTSASKRLIMQTKSVMRCRVPLLSPSPKSAMFSSTVQMLTSLSAAATRILSKVVWPMPRAG